jgi:hypothetical protein
MRKLPRACGRDPRGVVASSLDEPAICSKGSTSSYHGAMSLISNRPRVGSPARSASAKSSGAKRGTAQLQWLESPPGASSSIQRRSGVRRGRDGFALLERTAILQHRKSPHPRGQPAKTNAPNPLPSIRTSAPARLRKQGRGGARRPAADDHHPPIVLHKKSIHERAAFSAIAHRRMARAPTRTPELAHPIRQAMRFPRVGTLEGILPTVRATRAFGTTDLSVSPFGPRVRPDRRHIPAGILRGISRPPQRRRATPGSTSSTPPTCIRPGRERGAHRKARSAGLRGSRRHRDARPAIALPSPAQAGRAT